MQGLFRHQIKEIYLKHCCRNCHFLAYDFLSKEVIIGYFALPLNQEQRNGVSIPDDVRPFCFQKEWNSDDDPTYKETLQQVVDQNRRNKCFFWPYNEHISLGEAKSKYEREVKIKKEKKNNLYKLIGLVISAVGVIIAALGLLWLVYNN